MRTLQRSHLLSGILLITVLVYGQVLSFDFAGLDDRLLVTHNEVVKGISIRTITQAFTSYDPELYIPLTMLTYQLEYMIAGTAPWIYHLTNLLLHLTATILVFLCVERFYKQQRSQESHWIAALVTVVFALHPLNTQTVAWVAARKDLLSSVFCLGSILTYLLFLEREGSRRRKLYSTSIGLFALSLLSKVSTAPLPLALLLMDWIIQRDRKTALREKIPYGILSILFITIALIGKIGKEPALSILETALLAAKSSTFYLQNILLPQNLALSYEYQGSITVGDPTFLVPLLILLGLMGAAYHLRRKKSMITFGIVFYLLFLTPTLFTFVKNETIEVASDRYAYMAMLGIVIAGAHIVLPYLKTSKHLIIGGLALILAGSAGAQAALWKDEETILTHTLALYPHTTVSLINLGTVYYHQGNVEEAIALYTQARQQAPSLIDSTLNLARIRYNQGDIEEALTLMEEAIDTIDDATPPSRGDVQALLYYCSLLDTLGRTDEALTQCKRATTLAPQDFTAHHTLGIMNHKYGKMQEAYDALTHAVRLKPHILAARYRLSAVAAETGRLEEAVEHLAYVVRHDPTYENAATHLGHLESLLKR